MARGGWRRGRNYGGGIKKCLSDGRPFSTARTGRNKTASRAILIPHKHAKESFCARCFLHTTICPFYLSNFLYLSSEIGRCVLLMSFPSCLGLLLSLVLFMIDKCLPLYGSMYVCSFFVWARRKKWVLLSFVRFGPACLFLFLFLYYILYVEKGERGQPLLTVYSRRYLFRGCFVYSCHNPFGFL